MNIEETIKEAQNMLSKNPEWKERYTNYAQKLLENNDNIKSHKRTFNKFPPLYFYISTTKAQNAKSNLYLDVRYGGQSVAELKANKKGITISTKDKYDNNMRDFDCDIQLNDITWREKQASDFRKFFRDRPYLRNKSDKNKGNEEHNVEHLLLSEFSKMKSINKQILYIQPIRIGGIRFGMPTPLRASNHKELKYSDHKGGGIDIFARTGNGRDTFLTVIEVKDENNSKEPPKDALKQSIQYAVFIRELLRSDCGEDWYKIFGFSGLIPKKLTIRAVCAMPDDNIDVSFANVIYPIRDRDENGDDKDENGDDKIECHYIYFKYDKVNLTDFQTSLKQSLVSS